MGVTTVTHEFPIPHLPSAQLHQQRPQVLKPSTHGIKSMDLLEGQWDVPGSIFKVTYFDGGCEKYKKVASDHANKVFKNTLIEGGLVGDKVESADVEIKFVGESNPVMKITTTYNTKGDLKLTEAEISAEKNKATLISQGIVNQLSTSVNTS